MSSPRLGKISYRVNYRSQQNLEGGILMIINRKHLARQKLEKLKKGYSVYTETKEVREYLEKEIQKSGLEVTVDRTPIGSWFIPSEKEQKSS